MSGGGHLLLLLTRRQAGDVFLDRRFCFRRRHVPQRKHAELRFRRHRHVQPPNQLHYARNAVVTTNQQECVRLHERRNAHAALAGRQHLVVERAHQVCHRLAAGMPQVHNLDHRHRFGAQPFDVLNDLRDALDVARIAANHDHVEPFQELDLHRADQTAAGRFLGRAGNLNHRRCGRLLTVFLFLLAIRLRLRLRGGALSRLAGLVARLEGHAHQPPGLVLLLGFNLFADKRQGFLDAAALDHRRIANLNGTLIGPLRFGTNVKRTATRIHASTISVGPSSETVFAVRSTVSADAGAAAAGQRVGGQPVVLLCRHRKLPANERGQIGLKLLRLGVLER